MPGSSWCSGSRVAKLVGSVVWTGAIALAFIFPAQHAALADAGVCTGSDSPLATTFNPVQQVPPADFGPCADPGDPPSKATLAQIAQNGGPDAQVETIPVTYTGPDGKTHTRNLYRFTGRETDCGSWQMGPIKIGTHRCQPVYLLDPSDGKLYNGIDDWLKNNDLPGGTRVATPKLDGNSRITGGCDDSVASTRPTSVNPFAAVLLMAVVAAPESGGGSLLLAILALVVVGLVVVVAAGIRNGGQASDTSVGSSTTLTMGKRVSGNIADTGLRTQVQSMIDSGTCSDVCECLGMLQSQTDRRSKDGKALLLKIVSAQKQYGCRNQQRRAPGSGHNSFVVPAPGSGWSCSNSQGTDGNQYQSCAANGNLYLCQGGAPYMIDCGGYGCEHYPMNSNDVCQ